MRLLFVVPYIPSLVRVRPYNLVRALAERGHRLTLMALQPPGEPDDSLGQLREWCERVEVIPHLRQQTLANAALALPTGLPIQAAYSRSPAFNQALRRLLASERFDAAHVEHLRGAVLAEGLGTLPVVFDSVDSIALLFGKVLADAPTLKSRLMAQLDLARTRRFEGGLTRRFPYVTITSENDRQMLVELGCDPERVVVVPNGVDLVYFAPQAVERKPKRLVFTGKMSYHANIAAAEDLVHQVMPLVWAREPDAELTIVGKDPAPAVTALAGPKVTVTGSVPDMRPYMAEAAMAISTLRYAVGIQNKVLEAMAMQTPVVCSAAANVSPHTRPGVDLLVGETPEQIARHVLDLLASAEQREQIGLAGRRYVEQYHSWGSSAAALEHLYQAAAAVQPLAASV